jgi:hypothetical protein
MDDQQKKIRDCAWISFVYLVIWLVSAVTWGVVGDYPYTICAAVVALIFGLIGRGLQRFRKGAWRGALIMYCLLLLGGAASLIAGARLLFAEGKLDLNNTVQLFVLLVPVLALLNMIVAGVVLAVLIQTRSLFS